MVRAFIPVAGAGTRLKPHTYTQPKGLIQVAGKPILGHIIDHLKEAGIRDIVFIIGYLGNKIEEYVLRHHPDIEAHFVVQPDGKGTAHALWMARDLIPEHDPLLIIFGDTIIDANLSEILKQPGSVLGVKKVDDPRFFGVAELKEDGSILRLVEKPAIPKSNLALIGMYRIAESQLFRKSLEELISEGSHRPSEFHLTEVLMRMIQSGAVMRTFDVKNWFDCGRKDILLQTNAKLLKTSVYARPVQEDYERVILIPPVYIGPNCKISNSIIGPNVSIGESSHVASAIIQNSIIGSNSHIETATLDASVIGNDSTLKGVGLSLNLGDSTEINIG